MKNLNRLLMLVFILVVFAVGATTVRATDLYVSTNADNTNCDNDLTLREAILLARGSFNRPLTAGEVSHLPNTSPIAVPPAPGCAGPFGYTINSSALGASVGDSIRFENSVTTITPSGGLPFIYSGDFVFGLKPNGTKVILSGAGSGAGTNGLSFTRYTDGPDGGGATNLIIRDFTASGIYVEGIFCQFENLVINNNGGAGIFLTGKETSLGQFIDPRPRIESSFIYSNGNFGIEYLGTIDAIGTDAPSCSGHIINNYIGYRDQTLTTDDGNGSDGIRITNCSNIRIGISITDVDGGNYIGGNGGDGIQIKGARTYNHRIVNNRIGRLGASAGNGFGNDLSGISVLNGAGQQPASIFAPIQIGEPFKANVISGNAGSGVYLSDANSQAIISSNYIGTNTGANTDLGNGQSGISVVNSAFAFVGGDAPDEGNAIAFNDNGVYVVGGATTNATIRLNRIFSNDLLGIELNGEGGTPNDLNDADTGPNGLQNYPVLTGVSGGSSSTIVNGTYNSTPNRNHIVEFYGNSSCDSSGYGEGRTYLGAINVVTNASGNATFSANLPTGISNAGSFVTATVLDTTTAFTSEFSQCQPVTCNYSLSSTAASAGSGAASGSFQIITTGGCDWTAVSNVSWITITGGSSGSGNGTISFNIAANTGAARTGTITAGGRTFTVTQDALNCTYTLPTTSANVGNGGSSASFQLNTQAGCTWTATSNVSWLTITSGASGSGSGLISYSIAANTGAARTGTITAGGQTFTVNQATGCAYSLPQNSLSVPANGGTFTSSINAGAGCAWTATSIISWVTTNSSGSGNGNFQFTVQANTGAARSGGIVVGGQIFTVNQAAATATNRTRFDFDGDGKADVSVFRPSDGGWYLLQSQNGFTGATFGTSTDKIVPADYDGDGKCDLAVFRSGVWYLQRSSLGFTGVSFGEGSDIPMPADYDADGKTDIAVFRPSNGGWYLLRSTLGFTAAQFGQSGDVPVAGDYDGDGKADIAVFRSGNWYIQRSQLGFTGIGFGLSTDKPVPADYDADGKIDVAVFRDGNWYLQRSTLGFTGATFGVSTDKPAAADYDGDGKADLAVFRPSAGTWYLQRSTLGFTGINFGAGSDKPIPNAFVP